MPREHALKCAEFAAKDRLHRHSPFFYVYVFFCLLLYTWTFFVCYFLCVCMCVCVCVSICFCGFSGYFFPPIFVYFLIFVSWPNWPSVWIAVSFIVVRKIVYSLHGYYLSGGTYTYYIMWNIYIHYLSLYTVNYVRILWCKICAYYIL